MLYRGWKFNMFNDMKQVNKAIAAVTVIFVMFFFSLSALTTQLLEHKKSDHQSLTLVIFTYAIISMFSYFNVAFATSTQSRLTSLHSCSLSVDWSLLCAALTST